MSLKQYNEKRNFNITNEPSGKTKSNKSKKLNFVIQYHQARAKHYDFRLEYKGVMISFAVPKGLSTNPKDKRLAVHVEDHPLDYQYFEGVIPIGQYGAGTVEIFDKGTYEPLNSFTKGLKDGKLLFFLNGKKYIGAWTLVRMDEKNWLIIKEKDEFENIKVDMKNNTKTNKKSKNDSKNTKKPQKNASKLVKNPFSKVNVQLAKLTKEIPKGNDWLFEIKYDGYRIIAFIENGKVKLKTRNNIDYTQKFFTIMQELKDNFSSKTMVLDGEVVSFDSKGRTDFGLLQQNIKAGNNNLSFVIFDILALDGKDLRDMPLIDRKQILSEQLKNTKDLIFSEYVLGKGSQSFNLAKKLNLEGIVAKKVDSLYTGTRNGDWLKIKCYNRQEFVIGGFTTTEKNKKLSAILVGYYDNKKLIYVGKVGTGFTQTLREDLNKMLSKIIIKNSPFYHDNIKEKNIAFLSPKYIAEIQYQELTKEGLLRQPSFVGLRDDKKPNQVVLENKKWAKKFVI